MQLNLTSENLRNIRDVVPHLDLRAIQALKRAGFDLVPSKSLPQSKSTTPLRLLLARGVQQSV